MFPQQLTDSRAFEIAQALQDGFNKHYRLFREASRTAKHRFEQADWLAYLLVSGCGGQVHYDPWPSVRYRQHDENLSGSNVSLRGRWQRMRMLLEQAEELDLEQERQLADLVEEQRATLGRRSACRPSSRRPPCRWTPGNR